MDGDSSRASTSPVYMVFGGNPEVSEGCPSISSTISQFSGDGLEFGMEDGALFGWKEAEHSLRLSFGVGVVFGGYMKSK